MLRACWSQRKEKVHKQVSTQMSSTAFKIKENTKMCVSFDPVNVLSWLLSAISLWLGLVFVTWCSAEAQQRLWDIVEQWSFRKCQVVCWKSPRIWLQPLQNRGRWAGQKGGGTQLSSVSQQHLLLAVLGPPSSHGGAAMQSPLYWGQERFPDSAQFPFCSSEGWDWRQEVLYELAMLQARSISAVALLMELTTICSEGCGAFSAPWRGCFMLLVWLGCANAPSCFWVILKASVC